MCSPFGVQLSALRSIMKPHLTSGLERAPDRRLHLEFKLRGSRMLSMRTVYPARWSLGKKEKTKWWVRASTNIPVLRTLGRCCANRDWGGQPLHAANPAITLCFHAERLLAPGR